MLLEIAVTIPFELTVRLASVYAPAVMPESASFEFGSVPAAWDVPRSTAFSEANAPTPPICDRVVGIIWGIWSMYCLRSVPVMRLPGWR
ncbi:MAG: hypothetical protein U0835_00100 [Isosphaeraceae bacterium]